MKTGMPNVGKAIYLFYFIFTELTQPQGHSTSGVALNAIKQKEQLEWRKSFDCCLQMRKWISGMR